MRPLNVEFGPPRRWPTLLATGGAFFLVVVICWLLNQWSETEQQRTKLKADLAALKSTFAADAASSASKGHIPTVAYHGDAKAWATIASFDFNQIFRMVEATRIAGTTVGSIEINAVQGTALLEIAVPDAAAALAYANAINQLAAPSSRWQLVSIKTAAADGLGQAQLKLTVPKLGD
jgi:hypothetical protein